MNKYEDVMEAKLFSVTKVVDDFDVDLKDAKEIIAYCAKVSNPSSSKQEDMKDSDRLIKYLIDNAHWSPLEMVDATMIVTTTRDIGRQIIRHPTLRFQEWSQRYAEGLSNEDQATQLVLSECRLQDHKNRQNSLVSYDHELNDWWEEIQEEIGNLVYEKYKSAIEYGIAKETARKIFPEGMMTTRMFIKGSIRSWIHYLELRLGNGTQKEHAMLARECAKAINKVFKWEFK